MTLIPHPTPLEATIEASIAARLALPADRVTTTWNYATCPADQLGFLAWQLGLELWDESWPETKKRQVCAQALTLHRSKTTLAGIKAHVALVGCEVTRAIRPPARGFLRAAMTDEQRAAWLGSLPQLRLYPFADRATAIRRSFYRSPVRRTVPATFDSAQWTFAADRPSFDAETTVEIVRPHPFTARPFMKRGVLRASRGAQLLGTKATLADRGTERPIGYGVEADGALRLLIGSTVRRVWYGKGFGGSGFATRTTAGKGVVTLRFGDDVGQFAVEAGLDPVNVRPTRVAQPRIAPAARAFAGRSRAGTFLRTSFAPNLIFDQVPLHTPDRLGERRRTRSYHGSGRFGIRPFTAELRVAVPMQRSRRRSGAWHGSGFRAPASMQPLTRALEAIRVSKAMRDTVLVDTTTTRGVRFGDGLQFGNFAMGEIRKVS